MRVLGRIRLSKLTDESTSSARQREIIEQWVEANNHQLVGWAEDLDVSGGVDPFDTPELGVWLDSRMHDWDCVAAWKLDRLGRDSIRLNKLFGWAIDNGKTIVSCTEGIDLSTPVGRLIANVIAFLAEGELEAIRERNRASRKALLEMGRWPGGRVPYGYRPVELPTGGYRLQQDPVKVAFLRTVIEEVCDGAAVKAVAENHNIPYSTLRKMLKTKSLLGHAISKGKTVRDKSGNPILLGDPILTQAEYERLRDALEARSVEPTRTKDIGPMTGVIFCFECEQIMYHHIYTKNYGKGLYRYYHCRDKTHSGMIDAGLIEDTLEETFLEAAGDKPVLQRVYRPAEDHQIALDEAVRAVDELSALLGTLTSTTLQARLTEQMKALDGRIADLESLPSRPAGWVYTETGQTYSDKWAMSDIPGRRMLLTRSGIRFHIKRPAGTNAIQSSIYIPDEILDLLNAKRELR